MELRPSDQAAFLEARVEIERINAAINQTTVQLWRLRVTIALAALILLGLLAAALYVAPFKGLSFEHLLSPRNLGAFELVEKTTLSAMITAIAVDLTLVVTFSETLAFAKKQLRELTLQRRVLKITYEAVALDEDARTFADLKNE